jgi:hypothetical protein
MLFKKGVLGRKNWQSPVWRLIFLRACFYQRIRQLGDAFSIRLGRANLLPEGLDGLVELFN